MSDTEDAPKTADENAMEALQAADAAVHVAMDALEPQAEIAMHPEMHVADPANADVYPDSTGLFSEGGAEEIEEVPAIESPMPQTAVPFPHDPAALHAIDGLAHGGSITKTSRFGYSLQDASGRKIDGYPISGMGDALAHLPVGTTIEVSLNDQVLVVLPATDARPVVATVGENFHHACHQLWPWLVTEGFAVVS